MLSKDLSGANLEGADLRVLILVLMEYALEG